MYLLSGFADVINIIKDLVCTGLAMCINEVLAHPGDKVILESSFDKLME